MGFPAASKCGLNNKWQQPELGWRTLGLEKQAEKMVARSMCRETRVPAAALPWQKSVGQDASPLCSCVSPKGTLPAGTRPSTAQRTAPELGMACPQASKGIGVTHSLQSAN